MDRRKLEQKVNEATPEAFDALISAGPDELREKIVSLTQHEAEVRKAMDEDPGLKEARDALSTARGPYRDALVSIRDQRTLAAALLAEKGAA